jgi:sugar lactone lactonase YvrE
MSRELWTVVEDLHFSECPRWHDERLFFSDFYLQQVLSVEADGSDQRVEAEVPGQPSGLGWLPDGRMLVVSQHPPELLRRELDGSLVTHTDLSALVSGDPNDMVVDQQGRAWLGEFGFDLMSGAQIATARLTRVDPDGTATTVADDLYFPNGSVITQAGTLIVDETFGNRLSAFDIAEDGSLTNRRVWAEFGAVPTATDVGGAIAQLGVAPDGCCLDAEGLVWIADAGNERAVRVREGGEIVDQVDTGTGTYACMLGGPDGRTLFLCCAPDFAADNRRAAREGRILATTVEVPHGGLP